MGNKLRIDFLKNSNESELSYSTYHCYFFILFKLTAIYVISRNGGCTLYKKHCWHWQKKLSKFKRLQKILFKRHKKKFPTVVFITIKKNSHVSQVGKVLLIEKFSNRTICFTFLVFNQTNNNFHFQKVFRPCVCSS